MPRSNSVLSRSDYPDTETAWITDEFIVAGFKVFFATDGVSEMDRTAKDPMISWGGEFADGARAVALAEKLGLVIVSIDWHGIKSPRCSKKGPWWRLQYRIRTRSVCCPECGRTIPLTPDGAIVDPKDHNPEIRAVEGKVEPPKARAML